jgi:hypothetical protein
MTTPDQHTAELETPNELSVQSEAPTATDEAAASPHEPQWCYVLYGQKNGPIEHAQMLSLIASGVVKPTTSVWCGGDTWLAAQDTLLGRSFVQPTRHEPPALAAQDIDNRYVWMVVAVPIVGLCIELLAGKSLFWVYWIMNIGLCMLDERKLRQAGHQAPDKSWALVIPAYLWKRTQILGQPKHYFWAWVATWVLSIIMAFGAGRSQLEDAACDTVTSIVHQQLYSDVDCKAVEITDEVSDGFYRATATLDNGKQTDITIEERASGKIYVQVTP